MQACVEHPPRPVALLALCGVGRARAGLAAVPRARPGRATPRRAALPLAVERDAERQVEGAGRRRRAGRRPSWRQGRVWLTTAVEMPASGRERAGLSLRALAFDVETGKRRGGRRGVPPDAPAATQPEEQLRVADADPGRRPRLRPLRRRRHGGALDLRRDPVEGALRLRVAARRRRIARALQRPADLQLRRQRRRGVRGGAGRTHRARSDGSATGAGPRSRPTRRRSSSPSTGAIS